MFSVCRLCCSLSPALLLEVTGGVVLLLFTVHENQNVVCSQCSACPQHFGSLSRVRTSELSMRSTCQPRRTQPWKLRIRLVLEGRVSGRNIRARPPRGTCDEGRGPEMYKVLTKNRRSVHRPKFHAGVLITRNRIN
ncbi:Phenylethanolamine N-methyltransferase [Trichinella spiralis]|uniref:Phenylethanolamine N-methyltransferase n=1 Tax=Trichinella spiralis TaxID=6334 RepID=A0ABR3K6U8_TRISP